ncbi:DGQHR domain-containing protein [Hyphomicrobium sp. NDB2Meth4]|uniref:DGQHR domain-containing protein n=1 Tax=Hyphomicrobium sp. NDB2Meth4 TaxID=1892846 RepID=UPI00093190C8|nr:DGQHR domain-containing protein [Hyphomicrobium sp. NDB2Meth4]
MASKIVTLDCFLGQSANRPVLLGYAPASLLCSLSFADVLNEDSGRGYQRRFNSQHSLDFRRYIQRPTSTTIPLTFNLRPREDQAWTLVSKSGRNRRLNLATTAGPLLTQVDCQHRLGHLADLALELPFMCFVGLSDREEMEVFNTINSKAKGLSSSLLDFHDAQLATDLAGDRPELLIALFLRNEPSSPWHQQLDIGGERTSGLMRRASLRTLQKAIKLFLCRANLAKDHTAEELCQVTLAYWQAVAATLPREWAQPRKHFLTKGIGVYALMELAADLCNEADRKMLPTARHFCAVLGDFMTQFDWSSSGPLKGLGGESGVTTAVSLIRQSRARAHLRMVANG